MSLILVADDEKPIRTSLEQVFTYERHEVVLAASGTEALAMLQKRTFDAAFLDIKMPGMEGIEVLRKAKPACPETAFVIMSAHGTVQTAVEATRLGAFDFVEKPIDRDRLMLVLRNALAARTLSRENRVLKGVMQREVSLIGESAPMRELVETILKVAPTDARVLITGENGTGKELVARAVHANSRRGKAPFVAVNCAALPAALIESELFGHVAGAFTGASGDREGKFEAADKGTLFLDEVGDMPMEAQAKLLRALEENSVVRVGSNDPVKVDVRVLAATNQDISALITKGGFREDLFFRLNVFPIQVPPLRNRKEDIPLLAAHFQEEFCRKNGVRTKKFDDEALDLMKGPDWKGNVRELRNFVERVTIVSEDEVIGGDEMKEYLGGSAGVMPSFGPQTYEEFRDATDRLFFEARLRANDGNIKKTAEEIKLSRSVFYRAISRLGLKRGAAEGEETPEE